jgi:hypothetical protein
LVVVGVDRGWADADHGRCLGDDCGRGALGRACGPVPDNDDDDDDEEEEEEEEDRGFTADDGRVGGPVTAEDAGRAFTAEDGRGGRGSAIIGSVITSSSSDDETSPSTSPLVVAACTAAWITDGCPRL